MSGISENIVEKVLYKRGVWEIDLKYNTEQVQNIINQVYSLERKKHTSNTRTFVHKKGFSSDNLIKLPEFKPLINDITRIINNELALTFKRKGKYPNFAKNPNYYFVTDDVWTVIWRKGDFNPPHTHPGHHIAGAFYFKIPDAPNSGGNLAISNPTQNQFPIFDLDNSNGLTIEQVKPQVGKGIFFRGDLEHFVLPSYTDEDRICIACNFRLENIQFNKVYPAPTWSPHSLNYTFPNNDTEIEEIKNTGFIKYKLVDGTYLKFQNPYKGDLNQVKGKLFVIEFQ